MRKLLNETSVVATAVALAIWGVPACAQEDGEEPSADQVATVLVTATRRAQDLQDVPLSVSVLSEEDLLNTGTEQMKDLSLPNFVYPQFYTTTRSYISVRGIFQEAGNMGVESGFSTYLDGVYMGRNMSYNVDAADIERVELLRGPQGTLFGRNTIAGLLNLTSVKPKSVWEGRAHVQLGNYGLTRARAMLNAPIVDDVLAMRISAHSAERDGYVKNTVTGGENAGNIDYDGFRAQFLFTPTSHFSLYATADYSRSDSVAYVWENSVPETGGDRTPYTQQHQIVPRDFAEKTGASLTAEYEFENGCNLTLITGYRDDRTQWWYDEDGTANDIILTDTRDRQKQWSQEVRVASPQTRWYDFVLGVYAFDQDGTYDFRVHYRPEYIMQGYNVIRGAVVTQSVAAFGHANFHVTDALNLFTGLRYTVEEKELRGDRRVQPPDFDLGDGFIVPPPDPPLFIRDIEDEVTSFTAGAQYTFNNNYMAYASVSTGYKSAGLNIRDGSWTKPETVTSYELGFKSTLLDRRLNLNVAAFYSEYDDLQVRSLDATTLTIRYSNAASVISKGFEVELSAKPIDRLAVDFGAGYVDSTYDSFPGVLTTYGLIIDASGNRLPMTPKWTINAGAHYEQPVAAGAAVVAHLDYIFVSDRFAVLDAGQNDPGFALPDYGVVNGRLGYRAQDGRWDLYVWGKNLTNKVTPVDRRPWPQGGQFYQFETYLEPRTYGLSFTVNF